MFYVLSRFNHDISWLPEGSDYVVYDRSDHPLEGSTKVPNIGSDIYDKFTFIIDNYDNLPEVAVYAKANLPKYITMKEFNRVKDNTTFTPLLTQYHETDGVINFYKDKMYHEINNYWYINPHPARYAREIIDFFKMYRRDYNAFAPGSNYIVPKRNILKHSKQVYERLRSYMGWDVYPGDAQLMERNLYYLWK